MSGRIKYPRTMHLHWSPGMTSDDKKIKSYNGFLGRTVVVTLKKDGENSTGYPDGGTHARSLDSQHHSSRDWFKRFWAERAYILPQGWRICGENLYARHSVAYTDLPSYFMGFSIWNEHNVALSWDDTLMWFEELGVAPVEEIYRGPFDVAAIEKLTKSLDINREEGIVVRVVDEIPYDQFDQLVAKWVRKGHVQTEDHWMHQEIVPNGVK